MNTLNGYSKSKLSNDYVLTASGGHTLCIETNSSMLHGAYGKIMGYSGESGWHRIATIGGNSRGFGYGSYTLYLCGSWNNRANTNAIIHINTMHTTGSLALVSGIVGFVTKIRLVNVSANKYYVDIYVDHDSDNVPGSVWFYFLGNGDITTNVDAEKITDDVTATDEIILETLTGTGVRSITELTAYPNGGKLQINTAGNKTTLGIKHLVPTASLIDTSIYTTVQSVKDALVTEFNKYGTGIGSNVVIPAQAVINWDNDSKTLSASSVYSMIKIGGGYPNTAYGQWLLSSYNTETIKYVGRTASTWSKIYTIASLEWTKEKFIPQTIKNNTGDFNANSLIDSTALYVPNGDIAANATSWSNFPTTPAGGFSLFNIKEGFYNRQIYGGYGSSNLYTRYLYYNVSSKEWSSWSTILDSNNYLDYVGVTSVTLGTGNNTNTLAVNTGGTTTYLTIPYATKAGSLDYKSLYSSTSNEANTVWCSFARVTFNDKAWSMADGYLFFGEGEGHDYIGILKYSFRASSTATVLSKASLEWLVKNSNTVSVIAVKVEDNIYDLYINNCGTYSTPIIYHMSCTPSKFAWNVGQWSTTKPTVAYESTDVGIVSLATIARALGTDDSMKLYASASNEINFGGIAATDNIYIGYRATDSKSIPKNFIFGGSSGTSTLKGSMFISTVEAGTAPFTVTSTTKVSNLNADMLDGYHVSSSQKPWGTIPVVAQLDGVMEIGKYLDFHNDNTTGNDYSTRLLCGGEHKNIVTLPSSGGTLALVSDITNYYWANVKVSSSSSITTTPTFGETTLKGNLLPYTTHAYNIGDSTHVFEKIYTRYIDTDSGYNLRICVNGSEKISINATYGRVGINNINPAYLLDVTGTFNSSNYLVGTALELKTDDAQCQTTIFGSNNSGYRMRLVRLTTSDNLNTLYSPTFVVSTLDTHAYIAWQYGAKKVWVGAGSGNKWTWRAKLLTDSDHLIPSENDTYDIGSTTYRWNTIYGNTIYEGGTALSSKYLTSITYSSTNTTTALALVASVKASGRTVAVQDFTGTVGSSVLPIYFSSGIPTKVTSIGESYLSWGPDNKSGTLSPVDAAMDSEWSANRLSFMKTDQISIEYSTDSGSSWSDYALSDDGKTKLVTSGLSSTIYLGKKSTEQSSADLLRITITADSIYFSLKKIYILISSAGATVNRGNNTYQSGLWCILEKLLYNTSSYVTVGTYYVTGWSGWNSIPFAAAFGSTQTLNVKKIRLTFKMDSTLSSYTSTTKAAIYSLAMVGETSWVSTHSLLKGHLYSYNYLQEATFPASITGTNLISTGYIKTKGTLTLEGTDSVTARLIFSRSGALTLNYINWPGNTSESCLLAFGYSNSSSTSYFYMSSLGFYPAETDKRNLGTTSNRWKEICGVTGNFSGNITITGTLSALNGNFTVNANGAFWTSDRKFKKNIHNPVKSGLLDDETGLIRKFDWKETGKSSYGFIAQELIKYVPEAVDYDEYLNKYSVNYDVAHSAAIAQLVIKVKELESEILRLKLLIN